MSFCLDCVHEEDRHLVRNAVLALQSLKKEKVLSSWSLTTEQGGISYILTAFLVDSIDCEFSAQELNLLHDISPLRIRCASVGRLGGKVVLRVRISHRDEPLTLTETQVVSIRKRTRWMG